MVLLLLLIELLFLYLLSRRVIQTIYLLILRVTRVRSVAISLVTIIFFPGTVVHELAHLFVAEILRVRTGKLTLVPESLEGSEIKAGGVMIAETDPLRRTLIGLAPVYVGIGVLATISWWLPILLDRVFIRPPLATQGEALQNGILLILALYALFAISNSMFSSKEDMKGVIPFTITVAIFATAAYMTGLRPVPDGAGLRVGLTGQLLTEVIRIIETLVRSLGLVIGVNVTVLLVVSVFLTILKRLTTRHQV